MGITDPTESPALAAEAFGVGSVAAADDATLTTTEQDLMLTGALDGAITTTPGVTHQDATASTLNGAGVTSAWFDATTTQGAALTANINLTDTAWNAADTITITGTLTIVWSYAGDF